MKRPGFSGESRNEVSWNPEVVHGGRIRLEAEMPWEHVGGGDSGQLPGDIAWIGF